MQPLYKNIFFYLVVLNTIIFLAMQWFGVENFELFYLHHPANPNFKYWQFLTYIFMHGSFMHLLFNMFALLMLSVALQVKVSSWKLLVYYLLSGILCGLVYSLYKGYFFDQQVAAIEDAGMALSNIKRVYEEGYLRKIWLQAAPEEAYKYLVYNYRSVLVGASGAIYSLLVLFCIFFPNYKLVFVFFPFVGFKAKYLIPTFLLVEIYLAYAGINLFGQQIAHDAHVIGALVGLSLIGIIVVFNKLFLAKSKDGLN